MNSLFRILIVDNDNETRNLVMSPLIDEGYFVNTAANHDLALEMCTTFKPHLVIIKINMPEGKGFELLAKLKIPEGKFKVIFVSEKENVDDIQTAYRLGATGCLTKPIKSSDVIEQVLYGIECLKNQEKYDRYQKQLEKEVNERTADITKALEIAEYQSRQNDLLFNCMSEPLVAIDFENNIMFLNAASEKFLRLVPCDCLGMHFSEYIKDPNLIRAVKSITNNFKVTGEAITVPPMVCRIDERIYSVSINILMDLTEKPSGCVLLFSDQTELYRSSQLRSGFLTLVAHEFRTPLAALLNGLDLLKRGDIDRLAFTDVLDLIDLSIKRFSRLINNLLTFASVQNQDATQQVSTFSFIYLIDTLKNTLYTSAIEKNIELVHTVDSEFDVIATDEQLLRNSLECIIENAIKFSPIKSTVHIKSSLLYSNDQHYLKVAIIDSGPGISDTKLKKMFEWFTQEDDRLSRGHQGIGIGLPLSLRAIEILKGSLDYTRNEEGGSCFTLTVPVELQE